MTVKAVEHKCSLCNETMFRNEDEEEYPVLDKIGGERIFQQRMDWDELYNPHLYEKIKKVEK